MAQTKFKLSGLTCHACVMVSKMKVGDIDGVENVEINDGKDEMSITAAREVAIDEVKNALTGTHYQVYPA